MDRLAMARLATWGSLACLATEAERDCLAAQERQAAALARPGAVPAAEVELEADLAVGVALD